MEAETKAITELCQKQVNYWHSVRTLNKNEIAYVKKIAKLAILNRSKGTLMYVNVLDKGSSSFSSLIVREML